MTIAVRRKIWAVIVAYHPIPSEVISLAEQLRHSDCYVVVVDNTEAPFLSQTYTGELVELGYNSGVAHAQNVGAKMALADGADVVLFFDQDSSIDERYVPFLLDGLCDGAQCFVRCPVVIDRDDGDEHPSLRISSIGLKSKVYGKERNEPVQADVCISSGSAVAAGVFDVVGFFNTNFFIDHVDTEWFMRCKSESVPVAIMPNAILRHKIGSGKVKVGPMITTIHSHKRTYYQARNTFYLLRCSSVPMPFSIGEIISLLIHKILQIPYAQGRRAHTAALLHGSIDGILSRKVSKY